MPIYAYECSNCGYTKDVLQKLSDKHLEICPECGKNSFARKLTAAGFVLKGSGWYATDFRDGQKKEPNDTKSDKNERSDKNLPSKDKSKSNNELSNIKSPKDSKGSVTKNTNKTQSKSV